MTKTRFSVLVLLFSAALASQNVLADKGTAPAAIGATGMISASELPGAWDTQAQDAKTARRETRLREYRDIKRKMREFGLPAAIVSH